MSIRLAIAAVLVASAAASINAQSPAPSSSGGLSITAFDRLAKTTAFGGYFDTEWKSTGKENSFIAHRLVLQTSAQPHPAVLFNTELEYEYGGAVNALGNTGEIKLEQAWVDYRANDLATIRAGIVLVPFGRLNYLHDSDVRDTTNRPILNRYVVPTTWSDTGVGVHGSTEIANVDVTYEAFLLNGLTATPSTSTGIRSVRPGFKKDNNTEKAFAMRLGVNPSIQTEMGFSFYNDLLRSNSTTGSQEGFQMYGFDVLHKMGAFEVAGEFALSHLDTADPTSTAAQQDGYFIEARYHYLPEFLKGVIGANQFDDPSMVWFVRHGEVELNRGGSASKSQKQTTWGVNYRPLKLFAMKFEYEFNRGDLSEGDEDALWSSVAFGF